MLAFNGISTSLGLFYVQISRHRVHCIFIFTFLCSCFLDLFFVFWGVGGGCTIIWYQVFLSNTDNLNTVVWFPEILSASDNHLVSSNYFYLMIVICLYLVIWFQVIIIILMSGRRNGYIWPSLATSPIRSSPLEGLQGYIPYPHIAAVCMFKLVVLLLPDHMRGSIGVNHLWVPKDS